MEKWYKRNNTIIPSEAFYEDEKSIMDEINQLKIVDNYLRLREL